MQRRENDDGVSVGNLTLSDFEKEVLRGTAGPKEVTGVWRKLHEELGSLYSLSNTDDEMMSGITRRVDCVEVNEKIID